MPKTFITDEWATINARLAAHPDRYGWPERREGSVVLAGFNIRKCGNPEKRTPGALDLLARFIAQCDLVAVQEVMDDLEMLMTLKDMAGEIAGHPFEVIVSDVTGGVMGGGGMTERLAFVFRPDRIIRGPVAGDISIDRTAVLLKLYRNREDFLVSTLTFERGWWTWYDAKIAQLKWDLAKAAGKAKGKRPRGKTEPRWHSPHFVSFIRTPHMATFTIPVKDAKPYELSIINAHLLFGGTGRLERKERENEFHAVIDWMRERAMSDRSHNPNYVLIGDLNLAFRKADETRRKKIIDKLKGLGDLKKKAKAVKTVNFPFIIPRQDPITQEVTTLRTNARASETFDQIGIIAADARLPSFEDNAGAGATPDGYDYNVFNFSDLFSEALLGEGTLVRNMGDDQSAFVDHFQHDVSDHMPIWMRLPV